ncbi:MAG: nitrous oxide reductase family maturation protein NosD [Pseudorhodobacter sp.]
MYHFLRAATIAWIVATALVAAPVILHPAAANPSRAIAPSQDLSGILATAPPGTVLDLSGGDYGILQLRGFSAPAEKPVILRSRDPANPARLSGMDIRESSGLVLQGLIFDYRFRKGDKGHLRPFQLQASGNVTFRQVIFDGDIANSGEGKGYPTAFGLSLRGSKGIVLEDSEIRDFYRGLVVSDSADVTIRRNNVHSIRMDGMNFAQVDGVRIEGNWIHDFKRAVDSKDHSDMIQFWTNRTEWPSRDIMIRDNVLNSGLGAYTQSIFMRNDLVDRGLAGPEMFYRNVTIEENVIVNAHLHGITVGETDGLTIRNNTLVHNARSDGEQRNDPLWRPQIRVAETARDVVILANAAHRIPKAERRLDWTVQDNIQIQDQQPGRYTYFKQIFTAALTGDPRNLDNFRYLPDGVLARAKIGASRLQPENGAGSPDSTMVTPKPADMRPHGPPPANPFLTDKPPQNPSPKPNSNP